MKYTIENGPIGNAAKKRLILSKRNWLKTSDYIKNTIVVA